MMNEVNRIINESGISKVNVAKFLGVSRQMLYNYLALSSTDELPKDKQNKLLLLLGVENESELKNIKVNEKYIATLESKINDGMVDDVKEQMTDFKGLGKKEQTLLTEIFVLLKEKLLTDLDTSDDTNYKTLKYLQNYLQSMEQFEELKYVLAYVAKINCITNVNEYIYDEDKQYIFEGIVYSAMNLYSSRGASRSKVAEQHKKLEMEIAQKNEEKLSRTEELFTLRKQALQELGYSSINESNGKEVFEKIFDEDIDPVKYVEENGLKQVNDEGALKKTVEDVIAANPQSVEDYRSGKEKAIGFLVGQTMKAMKGKANPAMVNDMLKELLK